MHQSARRLASGRWTAACLWGLAATMLLVGCARSAPPTPATYRDDLNPTLSLELRQGGAAVVVDFPAAPEGECIELNAWPKSLLRSGDAQWSLLGGNQIQIEADGWVAILQYEWRRGSADFTELRYPTCPDPLADNFFLLRNY